MNLEHKVDEYLQHYLDLVGFSGVILIGQGGDVMLKKGYGMANVEHDVACTPETVFQIASVSKPFTAAAVLQLVERGDLSTDDPVQRLVPDYPRGDEITLHHLLNHFSGIPNINTFPEYDVWSKFPQNPMELVNKFKNQPLDFSPGERYQYSNSNYNFLAYIIELVSGKQFQTYMRTNILDVLGLTHSGHSTDGTPILKHRAAGYMPVGETELENAPYLNWSIKAGNGSMYSTVDDLFRWDRALYTEEILPQDLI